LQCWVVSGREGKFADRITGLNRIQNLGLRIQKNKNYKFFDD
jgi:hypothetical protein